MYARVSSCYYKGKRLPIKKAGETVEGYLSLGVNKNPVTLRCDVCAIIQAKDARQLLPALHDAVCTCIAEQGFFLRGSEVLADQEFSQEWWCIPLPQPEAKTHSHK